MSLSSSKSLVHKPRQNWKKLQSFFLAGAEAGKITKFRLRLRLLVNCKAENYEFCIFVSGQKIIYFQLLRIQSFLPYNSPEAGAVLFLKGRSRRKSGGSGRLRNSGTNVDSNFEGLYVSFTKFYCKLYLDHGPTICPSVSRLIAQIGAHVKLLA